MGIGLALAGGGLKGIAHIGAVKALKELGVKIEYVSGTSSGSLIAALVACEASVEEMTEVLKNNYKILSSIEKKAIAKLLGGFVTRRDSKVEGLCNGEKVEKIVEMFAGTRNIKHISDVKIPFAAVTCDTVSMKECISVSNKNIKSSNENVDLIYDISLGKAVRASMSFPGIYTTCNHEKYNLIDGGTKNNLPVDILKDMGADKVIAISFNLDGYMPDNNLFNVVIRALDIFSLDKVMEGRKKADVSCVVTTEDTSLLGIKDINAVINAGYNAVMEHKEEILKLL